MENLKDDDIENESMEFGPESEMEDCQTVWLVSGPPFDQRDYMISPSESSTPTVKSEEVVLKKEENCLRPSDIKIDEKYILDSHRALKKLLYLIKDGSAEKFLDRVKRLLFTFLEGSPPGFLLQDLETLIEVVEYFTRKLSSFAEYFELVKIIICQAKDIPKIEKTSDILLSKKVVPDYFTLIGELLATFEEESIQHHLLQFLILLVTKEEPAPNVLKLSHRIECLEKSQLPAVIATLMETVSENLYFHYVELALQMVMASQKCGYVMIENNILSHVLSRLDLFSSEEIEKNSQESHRLNEEEKELQQKACYKLLTKSSSLIWSLSMIFPKFEEKFELIPRPGEKALWSLKFVFLREAKRSTQKALECRNNFAAIILKLCNVFGERLDLTRSGLDIDIARLAIATEKKPPNAGIEGFKFSNKKEDFLLKKLMLLGCCSMSRNKTLLKTIKSEKVIKGLLSLVSSKESTIWLPSQYFSLFIDAMRTLSELVPKLPEVYIEQKGSSKLFSTLNWLMKEHLNRDFLHETLKTLCAVATCENSKEIVQDMKTQNGVKFMIEVCFYLLDVNVMKMVHQNKLSRVLVLLERMLINDKKLQAEFAESCVKISLKLLQRILANLKRDSKWNPLVFISFGGFFWEAVAWCSAALKLFIQKGGVFHLLDFIEMSSFPVQLLFLGVLVDMTDEGETIAHLLTWRGKNGFGVLNMMIDIWRKEEYMTKVHRTETGIIKDVETPLMTEEQWYLTHQIRDAHIYSPSIAEMVCSVRPKVHALYQFLQRRYSALTEIGEASYGLRFKMVKPSYRVYLPLIEHFLALKMGEVWFEVLRDTNVCGIIPTSFDGQMLCTLIDEKNKWACRIKTLQEEILLNEQGNDVHDEIKFYDFLKYCRMSSYLEAMSELEYISRTSFRKFQAEKKERQLQEVEKSLAILPFPEDVDIHRSYLFKTNITCLPTNYLWIKSEIEKNEHVDNISLISPESSSENIFF